MIKGITLFSLRSIFRMPAFLPVLLLCLSSCIKEEFDPEKLDPTLQIKPGVAAPIGWAKYRLDEILTDSLAPDQLQIGQDGFITMVYQQDLYSLFANEMIRIPDLSPSAYSVRNTTGLPIDLSALPGMTSYTDTITYSIPLQGATGAEIDSIIFGEGDLSVTASTSYGTMDWDAKINIIGVSTWGITLDEFNSSRTSSLAGLTIPLDNTPPASNEIGFAIEFNIYPSNGRIDPGLEIISFSISMDDMEFSIIYGYLGRFAVDAGPETFPVSFFERLEGGTFHFSDPRLTLEFENSFGIPIQIGLSQFYATGKDGQDTYIDVDGISDGSDPKILAYPEIGEEGQRAEDSLVLTPDNTNLFGILETSPTSLTVEINGATNPAGPPADNFIMDTSSLHVSTSLRLPMEGYADILLISDTLEFSIGDLYETPEEIKQLIFRMNHYHSFPVDLSIQVYFTDENYQVLDSLFHDEGDLRKIVDGSEQFDADGKAQPVTPDAVEIPLTSDQIDNITGSRYIIVIGRVATTGSGSQPPQNVKFFADYFFHTYLGTIAELEVNPDDF